MLFFATTEVTPVVTLQVRADGPPRHEHREADHRVHPGGQAQVPLRDAFPQTLSAGSNWLEQTEGGGSLLQAELV